MKLLSRDTYLAMIKNSVGSTLFRTLYAEVDGKKEDILKEGELSCTFFVSSILWHFRLLTEGPHANTPGLVRDLEKSGWVKTDVPTEGAVVIWEVMQQKSGPHPHSGFYVNSDKAISHIDNTKTPQEHHNTFGTKPDGAPQRRIIALYTHSFLD